ncbi:MAG: copper resistance protein CopC [Gemmatimonadota bacterium]|nr:copper resistance protein CopC [Gemmatimonadota bacterium]
MRVVRAIPLLAFLLLAAAPRAAYAHAHLARSAPMAGARINVAPHAIQLWFSEAPEVSLTTISLTNASGAALSLASVSGIPDTAVAVVAMIHGELAPGDYTVTWRTVAADDGHPSSGTFSFTVIGGAVTRAAGSSSSNGLARAAPLAAQSASPPAAGLDVESPTYVAVRWLSFMGLVLLLGVVAFRILVMPRVGLSANSAFAQREAHDTLSAAIIPQLANLGLFAGFITIVAAIGRLLAEQAVMAASMSMGLAAIVYQTAWGGAWLLQVGVAIAACVGFALARVRFNIGWMIAGIAALVLATTPALSGHAAGMPAFRILAIATDAVHVMAAGAWLGSLSALVLVALPVSMRAATRDSATGLMADMVHAFSPIALVSASIVVLTGITSAWLRLGSISALWRSSYGVVLLVKLALVGGVFGAGAFNWLRMRVALGHAASVDSGSAGAVTGVRARFQQSGTFELIFGVLVIAATAVLVAMPTPVH